MSAYIDYTAKQGATFKAQLSIKNDNNEGINLLSYVVTGQVRRSYYSLNVTSHIICTYIDGANGILQISIPHANTANIRAGRYVYDVQALHGQTGENVCLAEGMITFTPEVTK